jgi:5-methyltetrahydrofolate--homocysteine methyltransferase
MMGVAPDTAVCELADAGAMAVGANCGEGPGAILPVIQRMVQAAPGFPLVGQPNAGLPVVQGGDTVYDVTPQAFAYQAPLLLDYGVRLLGSCCGSTPAYTAALATLLAARAGS